ncbi:M23 family metallopeptidase [Marinomonas sp. C2222]|uniref:M23 family metallopeptidase n=1 Tax=Marinomonas sargassi TaxID=2984494 RepID=A0ABT2YTH9_9GAMM|nr:M23 family metallopeptidase [Marinomonas sargassi]MCV2403208.1 M23 family metallopeptidase [Marinomonas sargassi]
MRDKVTISVSSIQGTKQFNLGKKTRFTLKVFCYTVFLALVAMGTAIYYLLHEAEFAKIKQIELEHKSTSLSKEIESLTTLKTRLETDLSAREERIQLVSDKLQDLENLLDMDSANDSQLESRLDIATINTSIRVSMLNQIPSGSPVKDARTSSGYGKRKHPVTGILKFHRGQDFAVNTGTPVYAPADGVIEITRPSDKGSGNFINVLHAYGFTTSYSHLSKFAVKKGDFVRKGDLIAYSGSSGLSSGPHLHYEVRFLKRALDPKPFIEWNVDNFDSIFNSVRGIEWESLVGKIESRVSLKRPHSSQRVAQLTAISK